MHSQLDRSQQKLNEKENFAVKPKAITQALLIALLLAAAGCGSANSEAAPRTIGTIGEIQVLLAENSEPSEALCIGVSRTAGGTETSLGCPTGDSTTFRQALSLGQESFIVGYGPPGSLVTIEEGGEMASEVFDGRQYFAVSLEGSDHLTSVSVSIGDDEAIVNIQPE